MSVKFDRLFDVEVYHNYYTTKISEDFIIFPTASCQRLLRNYGLLFRSTAKGFTVLYEAPDEGGSVTHPLKPVAESVRFSFALKSKKPHLINYSDLSLESPSGRLYYLNNLNDNPQNGHLLLSSDTNNEFISQQDALELKPQVFSYSFESSGTSARIEIRDQWSQPVIQKTVPIVEGKFYTLVDLGVHGPGKFALSIDGIQKELFYASDELVGKNIFGLIDIFRDSDVPATYQFTDPTADHDVLAKTYRVEIDNRKTYWKYYVVLKYRLKNQKPDEWPSDWPDEWSIVYPPDPTVKIEPQPDDLKTFGDGALAVPFVSDSELPLQQAPIKGVKLRRTTGNGNGSGIREIESLPNPSVTSIVPDDSENKIFSEMFIYV